MRMVAHATVKAGNGAIFVSANLASYGGVGNDVARQFDPIVELSSAHFELSPAHWRQESDFVSTNQRSIPRGKFLVPGCDQRGPELAKPWSRGATIREKIFDARAFAQFDGLLSRARELLQSSEIENFDEHTRDAIILPELGRTRPRRA